MWATVSALMFLVCPVLLSGYAVMYVLFYEQINGKRNGETSRIDMIELLEMVLEVSQLFTGLIF